jgi:hypothetical protein
MIWLGYHAPMQYTFKELIKLLERAKEMEEACGYR